MNKTLILLVLVIIVLTWNFVFTEKKIGLTDQAKVLQGLSSAIAYKTAVTNYWVDKGSLPDQDEWANEKPDIMVDISQTIINSIQVGVDGPGVISVYYIAKQGLDAPADIEGKKIILIPNAQDGKLVWTCLGTIPANLLPRNCSVIAGN